MGDTYKIDGQKIEYHVDRVAEWIARGDTVPIYVEVSPTARCNHNCTFCALDYTNHTTDELPTHKLCDLGLQLASLGVRGVMFGGEGEPTLHPELGKVIRHYTSLGIDCALTTNGFGLGPEFAEAGGNLLKWVKVSMNGGTAQAYSKVHRVPEHVMGETLDRAIEFRRACKAPCPTIGIQAVAVEENVASLTTLCFLGAKLEFDYVVIKPFSPNAYSKSKDKKPVVLQDSLVAQCRKYSTPLTEIIVRDAAFDSACAGQPRYGRCLAVPYFWAYVNAKGEVVACSNHMLDTRFILGNIYTSTLKDMWYSHSGDARESLKATMRTFDITQCRKACRMDNVNAYLWRLRNGHPHQAFI